MDILICILAGLGAGLGTGFAGMSAAAVIAPMLIVFLDVSPFTAVGVALASDVLASAVSAIIYGKKGNIKLKDSWIMMVTVLVTTIVGSIVSYFVNKSHENTMGAVSIFATLFLGVRFIVKPITAPKEPKQESKTSRIVKSIVCGIIIGFICGFVGAGGGIMMLLLLTGVMGYELKSAVGTSVFIMTFTALTGAVSHFVIDGAINDWLHLVICAASTLVFAQVAALIANKITNEKLLNRIVGVLLTILGIAMVVLEFFVK